MRPGDLVRMKPHVQPPELYGTGVVVKVESLCDHNPLAVRVEVVWASGKDWDGNPIAPNKGHCHPNSLEVLNESR